MRTAPIDTLPALPGISLPGVPVPSAPAGAGTTPATGPGTTPVNPSGLFPTVSPVSGHKSGRPQKATVDAAILPLSYHGIDSQLAGLAALLIAIAVAVARLSVRRRPQQNRAAQPPSATAE